MLEENDTVKGKLPQGNLLTSYYPERSIGDVFTPRISQA